MQSSYARLIKKTFGHYSVLETFTSRNSGAHKVILHLFFHLFKAFLTILTNGKHCLYVANIVDFNVNREVTILHPKFYGSHNCFLTS